MRRVLGVVLSWTVVGAAAGTAAALDASAEEPLAARRAAGALVVAVPFEARDSAWWEVAGAWVAEELYSEAVGAGVGAGAARLAADLGARRALARAVGHAARRVGGLFVSLLMEARVVGNPTRFQVLLVAEGDVGQRLTVDAGEAVQPLVAYDSGDETAWSAGIALEVEEWVGDGLQARWQTVETRRLTAPEEGAGLFNDPGFSTGRYLLAPFHAVRFAEAGRYRLTVGGRGAATVTVVARDAGRCGPVDLALLVDSSGSMQGNDPQGLRREAASLLVDRLPAGATLSVVDFDSTARTVVSRSGDRQAVRAALRQVDADGGTDVSAALSAGLAALSGGAGGRAAVLFTDGRSDRREGAEAFAAAGIPVHAVGLGPGVDAEFLRQLAAKTGGLYMQAAVAADLAGAFDQVVAELACEGTVLSARGRVEPQGVAEHRVRVDGLLERLVLRLTWPGSRLGLELLDPSGAASGVEVGSGATYRVVAVDDPTPGVWTARVTGEEVPAGGETYDLRAGGGSDLRLALAPTDPADPTTLRLGALGLDPRATVSRAWSRVVAPDGGESDGPSPAPAGSGEWTVAVRAEAAGVYTVTVGLAGTAPRAGEWAREVTRTLVVGQGQTPWRGRVTRVSGGYLTLDRGARHGVRRGMTVYLGSAGKPDGVGIVVSTLETESTVEVQELYGSTVAREGMRFELDRGQWMADQRPGG